MARGEIRPLSRWGAILLVVLVAFGAAACNSDTDNATPAPSASLPRASAGVGGPKSPSSAASSAAAVLADGRHAVYLTQLSVEKKTLTFDKIDFLTGEAAKKEYIKQNPGQTEGPDNDYLIINNNPLLRTLPIADSATVLIVDMTGGVAAKKTTLAALPAYFAPEKGNKILWHDPFWLTVKAGQITKIEEQFLP